MIAGDSKRNTRLEMKLKPDNWLVWYVLIMIAVVAWVGLTGKFDSPPKPASEPLTPQLTDQEKKEISDRYKLAITEITANYEKHYHKSLPYQDAFSIYMQCRQVKNYPPILRKDHEHLLEYICPSNEMMEMTEAEKAQAAAQAKNAEKVRKFIGE